jgi:hypothetical protein
MDKMGKMQASNVDQFVDELMTSERICDIILPRLQQRHVLEELGDVCAPKGLFSGLDFLTAEILLWSITASVRNKQGRVQATIHCK